MRSTLPPIFHDAQMVPQLLAPVAGLTENQIRWRRQIEQFERLWGTFRARNRAVAQFDYASEFIGHRPAGEKERNAAREALRKLRAWYPR